MPLKGHENGSEKQKLLIAALLFFLVLGAFLPCLWNGFISLDDRGYVSQNPHVQKGLSWESLKWCWTSAELQNWHPLTWMSHLVDAQLFGLNPAGHHATNVLLHAINVGLLFWVLEIMTGARWRSLAVALLFGVHPLRVESVAWVAERKDVLSVFFWLLCTWAYVRYVGRQQKTERGKQKFEKGARPTSGESSIISLYILSLALFALGLLAKPMLVTLPFVLLLLDYWPMRRWQQTPVKRVLLEKVPFLVLALASSVITYVVQEQGGAVTTVDSLSAPARIANALVSYVRYLGKTIWPVNLCILYPHPGHWPAAVVAVAVLLLAGISGLVLWRRRSMPYLLVGWFWYLGTLVPVIGLVQVGLQSMADRYTYIPSIGLLLAGVWGASKLTDGWPCRQALAWGVVAALTVACSVLTVRQIGYFKDTKTVFNHALAVTTGNWAAGAYLANELHSRGELDSAIAACQKSIEVNPYHPEVHCLLADMLAGQGRFEDAFKQYQAAMALDPSDAYARERTGGMLQNLGRRDQAIDQFIQAIRLKPDYAEAYSELGNCYGMGGRTDEAIQCFEQAVKLKPNVAQNHRELGVGLANKGRWDEAIVQFREALQLDPADNQARANLAAATQEKVRLVPPAGQH